MGNYIFVESSGDNLFGPERTKLFNNFNSEILLSNSFRSITLNVMGKQAMLGEFILMDSLLFPKVGLYKNTGNFPSHELGKARFWWNLNHFSCEYTEGSWFAIDEVELDNDGKLLNLVMRFEQVCAGGAEYLRGKIHWDRINKAKPVAPVYPVPSNIWNKVLDSDVEAGNYLYVEYRPSAPRGELQTKLLSGDSANFSLVGLDKGVSLNVEPKDIEQIWFSVDIQQGSELRVKEIDKGLYFNTLEYFSPMVNGISLSFTGLFDLFTQDCDPYSAWFSVDDVVYVSGNPTMLDMRFGIDCNGTLNGKIHVVHNSRNVSPGPSPIPSGLWEPVGVQASEDMSYIYLQGEQGSYIGGGKKYEYTNANALLSLQESLLQGASAVRLQGYISGDESWSFDLAAFPDHQKLKVGFYEFDNVSGVNPISFGLSGEGKSCREGRGWYAVDAVLYDEKDFLDSVDIRFAQFCGSLPYALYGKIHWRNQDKTTPPGPIFPVPDDLWQPASSIVLPNYNYLYLESDADDSVGRGNTYLLTQRDAQFKLNGVPWFDFESPSNRFDFNAHGDFRVRGHFIKRSATFLEPGLYILDNGPNPVKGDIDFSIDSQGCGSISGWFAVDEIEYDAGGNLLSIKYRFEQRCGGSTTAALRGKGFWQKHEPVVPSSPVLPIPTDLWRPVSDDLPLSGNYLYLFSEENDWVGRGETELMTQMRVSHVNFSENWEVIVSTLNPQEHAIHITGVYVHDQLQPGYYPNIRNQNPARGDISVTMHGRGCTNEGGWFVVDKVSYNVEGEITSLHARFKQRCERSDAALYGQLKWDS